VLKVHTVLDYLKDVLWLVVNFKVAILHLRVVEDVADHDDYILRALLAASKHIEHVRRECIRRQLRLEQLKEELHTTDWIS